MSCARYAPARRRRCVSSCVAFCCYQSTLDRPCICIGGKSPSHMAVIGVLLKLLR
jgi:hypothetical protein